MKKRILLVLILLFTIITLSAIAQEDTDAGSAVQILQYGDQGDAVAQLQQRLSDLGYYSGKITGNFLGGTRSSLKKFQKEYSLEVTGIADEQTQSVLMTAQYRVLTHGCDGEDVTRLQQRLAELGYFTANASGKFRNATRTAVAQFQQKNGLEASGEADLETQKLLFSDSALAIAGEPTPVPDSSTDLGDINDMVIAGDGEQVENPYGSKLSRGDKGTAVKEVQTRLTELGFFDGPISGNYMNKTVAAVKAFQTHNGKEATGVTDEETWNLLFNTENVLDINCTPAPTPEPTPIPYAITVDVRNQVTTVYGLDEEGEYTVPVRRMTCSTGMVGNDSDVGEWVLSGRRARWCYFPAWGSNAQYWTKINENIAFHSVIYNERGDSYVMSVKSYRKLGSRASHGCIRLLVEDAKWIYENIGKGVVVTITEDLPVDEELRKAVEKPALNSAKTGPVSTPQPTAEPDYSSDKTPPTSFRELKNGSEGEDVYWLQSCLKELGYYTGTVTGGYYSGTQKAVKAYQKDHNLSGSGKATVATLESIYAEVLATPTPCPTETPVPTVTPSVTPGPAQ